MLQQLIRTTETDRQTNTACLICRSKVDYLVHIFRLLDKTKIESEPEICAAVHAVVAAAKFYVLVVVPGVSVSILVVTRHVVKMMACRDVGLVVVVTTIVWIPVPQPTPASAPRMEGSSHENSGSQVSQIGTYFVSNGVASRVNVPWSI